MSPEASGQIALARDVMPAAAFLLGLVLGLLSVGAAVLLVALVRRARRGEASTAPRIERRFAAVGRGRSPTPELSRLREALERRERELQWKSFSLRERGEIEVIDVASFSARERADGEAER